ncbi:hypothetical protein [Paraburkholderia strydomiana]|uniref:hypothetical protein n=1 Tax=Paraburkholderia strydomiana TaxID=1245417 RepID=UPI001BE8211B|nr:hypothetical protein [Paraburkholderia strydomiana]MBT2794557.1 hypothetical protein [Paraburkholderia strydomiana]
MSIYSCKGELHGQSMTGLEGGPGRLLFSTGGVVPASLWPCCDWTANRAIDGM